MNPQFYIYLPGYEMRMAVYDRAYYSYRFHEGGWERQEMDGSWSPSVNSPKWFESSIANGQIISADEFYERRGMYENW